MADIAVFVGHSFGFQDFLKYVKVVGGDEGTTLTPKKS